MKVPLTILDHLERAELVYGDRVRSWSTSPTSPRRRGRRSPAPAWASWPGRRPAASTRLGVGLGERVAIVSQNSARLLTAFFGVSGYGRVLVPVNFRLNAREVGYIVEHSGASVLLVDPELDDALADVDRASTAS